MLNTFKRGIAALLSLILLIGATQLPVFATTEESETHIHEDAVQEERIVAEEIDGLDETVTEITSYNDIDETAEIVFVTADQVKPEPAKRTVHPNLVAFSKYYLKKLAACPEYIDVSSYRFKASELNSIYNEIFYKMPEAFNIESLGHTTDSTGTYIQRIYMWYRSFADTASEYTECYNKMMQGAETLLAGVDWDSLSDVNKALLLHDRLGLWAEYDYDNAYPKTEKRQIFTAYGILGERLGVCQGYSMAYMYLLDRVGIESGYVRSDAKWHGWNIVYINGVGYHVDVTWDADHREGRIYHNNFLISSSAAIANGHIGDGAATVDWEIYTNYSNTNFTNNTFDNYYWKESNAEFQYIGGKIYYINTVEEMLYVIEGNNHKALFSVAGKWYYKRDAQGRWYHNEQAKLASVGSKLLINTDKTIVAYDVVSGNKITVYTPASLGEFENIYGFKYENGKIICDIASHPDYSKPLRQISVSYTPTCDRHSYTVSVSTTPATCTSNAKTTYRCAFCTQTETRNSGPALGHSMSAYTSNGNATCTADGTKTRKCTRSGCVYAETVTDTGSKLGHNYTKTSGNATCTTAGTAVYKCTRCGHSYTETSGSPLGHSFTKYIKNSDATCTKDGTETAKCDRCSVTDTRTATGSKLGHSFTKYVSNQDATCIKDGTKTAKCDRCNATNTVTDPGSKTAHKWNSGVYVEGTSTTAGYTIYTCTTCGATKKEMDTTTAQITGHPTAVTVDSGNTAYFSVTTRGVIKSYQWQYRKVYKWFDTALSGYNTDTLKVTASGARNGYDYRCVITFDNGKVLCSEPAKLTVNTIINITNHPKNQTIALGCKAQFTAAATGENVKYQWQYCRPGSEKWIDTSMEGATKATVLVETTAARNGYQYRCEITDVAGNVTYTNGATLTVLTVKNHPGAVSANVGEIAQFTVTPNVSTGFTYRWQYSTDGTNWSNTTLTGYNTATLSVEATKVRNGYLYRCVLVDSRGNQITSNSAMLTVKGASVAPEPEIPADPAKITTEPKSATAIIDGNAKFTIKATGVASYKWQYSKNGTVWNDTTMTGYNTATLTVTATNARNGYLYRCLVTGKDGVRIESGAATLTVVKITEQPKAVTATEDTTASFSLKLSATTGVKYEWQYSKDAGATWTGTTMTGYNTATLTVAAAMSRNGYRYRCVVKDTSGNQLASDAALLTVEEPVVLNPAVITLQPKSSTAILDGDARFIVKATGAVAYKWYYSKNGTDWVATSMEGYNTNTLTVGASASRNGYQYRCTVTGEDGIKVDSKAATLTVAQITDDPVNKSGFIECNVKFTVKLSDTSGIRYEWQYRKSETGTWTGTTMTGYNTKTLTAAVTVARNGYQYRCKITDAFGNTIESGAATLTAVKITKHPVSQDVVQNGTALFTVAVTEGATVSYEWQYRKGETGTWTGTTMTGYNTSSLKVTATAARAGYQYRCMMTDGGGNKIYTEGATMRVLAITVQPVNVEAVADSVVNFTIATNIVGFFTYQWQYSKDGSQWYKTTMEGYNTATLRVEATAARNGYQYRCAILVNGEAVMTSEAAALNVIIPEPEIPLNPAIIKTQPKAANAFLGGNAQFTVKGTGVVSWLWQYRRSETANWTSTTMTGYNTDTLTVAVTAARNGYQYRCVLTGEDGVKVYTEAAVLGILEITEQPAVGYGFIGSIAKFTVKLSGTAGVKYQWQYRRNETANWTGTTMTGYNTKTLTVDVTAARNGYQYRCLLTDAFGNKLESECAVLTVVKVLQQPADQAAVVDSTAVFMVSVSHPEIMRYQWQYRRNDTANWTNTYMDGFDTDCLCVETTSGRNGYQYRCILKLENGSTLESDFATLTIK